MRTVVVKRHVKLKNLKYEIPGEETNRLIVETLVYSAIGILMSMAIIVIGFGILKSITQ
jgi:hypothetical protein